MHPELGPRARGIPTAPSDSLRRTSGRIRPTRPRFTRDSSPTSRAAGQSTAATQVFDDIKTALAGQPVPADRRSALFRTLALVPGITPEENTTDENGRLGTTIALETNGIRDELSFGSKTAELLATKTTITSPETAQDSLPGGATLHGATHDRRAITTTTERP